MRTAIRLTLASLLCVVMIGVLTGCGGGGSSPYGQTGGTSSSPPAAGASVVVEKDFAFQPASLEVKVGDTVTFTNEDSAPHNVIIDSKELGQQEQGASVTWTAEKAGSFPYSCKIHPSMTGEITVK